MTIRNSNRSDHAQRVHVGLEHRLVFHPLVLVLLAQAHHGTHGLHVVAVALGLGIDVADIVGNRLLLLLEPLDALDESLELILGETGRCLRGRGGFGSGGGHGHSSHLEPHGFRCERCEVKARGASSTPYAHLHCDIANHANQCLCDLSKAACCSLLASRWYFVFHSSYGMPYTASRLSSLPSATPDLSASSFIQFDRQLRQKPARFIRSMFCTAVRLRRCSTTRRKTAASRPGRVLSSRAMICLPARVPAKWSPVRRKGHAPTRLDLNIGRYPGAFQGGSAPPGGGFAAPFAISIGLA